MSNVDFGAGENDAWETDLYFGYRNSINDALAYDIGYTRYFFDATGNDTGEIIGQLTYSPMSTLDLTARVAYDPDNENWNYRGEVGFAVTDTVALNAAYGHSDFYDHNYWAVGGSYAISDATAASISYNGSDTKDEGWAAMLSFAF